MSCGPSKNKNSQTRTNDLTSGYWILQTLNGKEVSDPSKYGRDIGFELDSEKGRVSGFAGCNTFMGSFKLQSAGQLEFSKMASTRMACLDNVINEHELLEVFEKTTSFQFQNEHLQLMDAEKAVIASFIKSEPVSITGKNWNLKVLDGKVIERKTGERDIYFSLQPDENRIHGFSGCNSFSGTYDLGEDDSIGFSRMISTLRACPESDFNESALYSAFEKVSKYSVSGTGLTLYSEDGDSLAVFEQGKEESGTER